jgi:hypothetical protein
MHKRAPMMTRRTVGARIVASAVVAAAPAIATAEPSNS